MASLVLSGDTSGSITVAAPAVAGSNTQTLAAVTGTLAPIVSGTAVTASGTSVDFTGIPSWVKKITIIFNGLSLSGSDNILVQLGAGSTTSSGYTAASYATNNSGTSSTSGFLCLLGTASLSAIGSMTITNISGNIWVSSHAYTVAGTTASAVGGGTVTLSGTLDRVIVTRTGTNTFDAGSVNILYE